MKVVELEREGNPLRFTVMSCSSGDLADDQFCVENKSRNMRNSSKSSILTTPNSDVRILLVDNFMPPLLSIFRPQ
jgi:hypothetical protein